MVWIFGREYVLVFNSCEYDYGYCANCKRWAKVRMFCSKSWFGNSYIELCRKCGRA